MKRQKTLRTIRARYWTLMGRLKSLHESDYAEAEERKVTDEMFALRAAARSLVEEKIGASRRRPKRLTPLEKAIAAA